MKQILGRADPPDATVKAISHSICSTHPRTRYVVGRINRLPAKVIVFLASYLPDVVMDAMFTS